MIKNKILLSVLSLSVLCGGFAIVGCGAPSDSGQGDIGGNKPKPEEEKKIESLTINEDYKELRMAVGDYLIVDPDLYTIKPSGLPSREKKVKVTVEEGTSVTYGDDLITAVDVGESTVRITSAVNASISDTFKITVINPVFDRTMSDVDSFDFTYEDPANGGYVTSPDEMTGDLYFKGVSGTKWYCEASIEITSVRSDELWPKFGIFSASTDTSKDYLDNKAFYFINAWISESNNNTWTDVGICEVQHDNNWAWNPSVTDQIARHKDKMYSSETPITYNTEFKMAMARDGLRYYCWFNDVYAGAFDILEDLIPADVPSAPGLFEFNSNAKFSKYSATAEAAEVDAKITSIGEDLKLITTWDQDAA